MAKWDVAGTGLAVVDRIYTGSSIQPQESLGGSCGNVLLSLGVLSYSVAPILAFGADRDGDFLASQFSAVGVCTDYIHRQEDRLTPIIAQYLMPDIGKHWFDFTCPSSGLPYPKYQPVDFNHLTQSQSALTSCRVFYLDRLSDANVWALECAFENDAITILELSNLDSPLLQRALRASRIVKYSDDAHGTDRLSPETVANVTLIQTHGAHGLSTSVNGHMMYLPAVPANSVVDTCGAGDMVTVGLIDRLLREAAQPTVLYPELIVEGLQAGQRLAASNCGYVGARGFLEQCGATAARSLLYHFA